jgi:hypothetical protein
MSKVKLYALSICAMRVVGPERAFVTEAHAALVLLAASDEEAREKGLKQALKRWPAADSWVRHDAVVYEVSKDYLSRALYAMADDEEKRARDLDLLA